MGRLQKFWLQQLGFLQFPKPATALEVVTGSTFQAGKKVMSCTPLTGWSSQWAVLQWVYRTQVSESAEIKLHQTCILHSQGDSKMELEIFFLCTCTIAPSSFWTTGNKVKECFIRGREVKGFNFDGTQSVKSGLLVSMIF